MLKDKFNHNIIGIDLGTTNSLVSSLRKGNPEIIPNERGSRLTPSVVTFKRDDSVLIGELAKNQIVVNHDTTVSNIKREIGYDRKYSFFEREFTPVECSSLILRKLKKYTEDFLGDDVENAVITVPAYFNDNQRQATLKAGTRAGFNVLKLLNEPTAAAIAYGFYNKGNEHILVFDLGGGTLDITLMEYEGNLFKVMGIGGSTNIGGIDFDNELTGYITNFFQQQHSISLEEDPIAYQQVLINAERIKCDLSSVESTNLFIPYITVTDDGPLHLEINISRNQFEKLIQNYLDKIKSILLDTFIQAKVDVSWVSSIIFVGGATRIPAVRELVVDSINTRNNGEKVKIYNDINPDEVVALGAGIIAGIFSGDIEEIDFYDITSHELGIEDNNGDFIPIIPEGTSYPCEVVKLFTTTDDNQEEVTIRIVQKGINGSSDKTVLLGEFTLSRIPAAAAGTPDIDVQFRIDKHGIINIAAINLETGDYEEVVISGHEWLMDNNDFDRRGAGLKII